jgi:hypothetical protein
MLDKFNKVVIVGDYIKYWHCRYGYPYPAIGQITYIDKHKASATIHYVPQNKMLEFKDTCERVKSGITKMTPEEVMLWNLEN